MLNVLSSLSGSFLARKKFEEAQVVLQEFVDLARRIKGPEDPATLAALNNLTTLMHNRGNYAEEEPLLRDLMQIMERKMPAGHWQTAMVRGKLGMCLARLKRDNEAEPYMRAAYEASKSSLGEDQFQTEYMLANLYELSYRLGKREDALRLHKEAVRTRLRLAGAGETASVSKSIRGFLAAAEENGHSEEAERFMQELTAYGIRTLAEGDKRRGRFLANWGVALVDLKRYPTAEPVLKAAYEEQKAVLGERHGDTRVTLGLLVQVYSALGQKEQEAAYRTLLGDRP
jgi:tetratricopeptide (TPR) repeat protein